jgi:hypothetical protein
MSQTRNDALINRVLSADLPKLTKLKLINYEIAQVTAYLSAIHPDKVFDSIRIKLKQLTISVKALI